MADFKVIVNAAQECQVVPFDSTNPVGFQDVGKEGSREECDSFIKSYASTKTKKVMVALGATALAYANQKTAEAKQDRQP